MLSLPDFNALWTLPAVVYQALPGEVLARFAVGSRQRRARGERMIRSDLKVHLTFERIARSATGGTPPPDGNQPCQLPPVGGWISGRDRWN
jgi:hypothetical protein